MSFGILFKLLSNTISGDFMSDIFDDVKLNKKVFQEDFKDSSDFLLKDINVSGFNAFICSMDGLTDSLQLSQMIMEPMMSTHYDNINADEYLSLLQTEIIHCVEQNTFTTFEDAYYYLASGFCVIIIDGCKTGLALGIQGWTRRDTGEAKTEANVKGAKECFVESINDNKALLRKRLKTCHLKQKQIKLGNNIPTPVVISYLDNKADMSVVNLIENRLKNADLSTVSDYGELASFLDSDISSFFSAVGNTERPDVLASKLLEGRVAIMVEGTPFVIYVPYLFSDNFSALDDYDNPSIFSTFMRILRYFSFVVSLFLPGLFVAIGTFHQELIPTNMLFLIASNEANTPFSLATEAVFVHLLYEIMREGGLRLPENIGHAVSIIGGIVIGDAAVSAGIIGAPMLIIVAITAISSYVIYPLYESIAVLRILFIVVGGLLGIYGIMLLGAMVFCNICALNTVGVPYSAPLSPLTVSSLGDVLIRENWKKLSKRKVNIDKLKGSDIGD